MLQKLQLSARHLAGKALHGKMKCGIVVFDCCDALLYFDLSCKLLADFTSKGGLWSLTGFDFSAGEFPKTTPFAVTALGGEDGGVPWGDVRKMRAATTGMDLILFLHRRCLQILYRLICSCHLLNHILFLYKLSNFLVKIIPLFLLLKQTKQSNRYKLTTE